MRQVYIDDDGRVQFLVREHVCTGIAARWCPIHGDCTDEGVDTSDDAPPPYSDHCSDPDCPLHGLLSHHAEFEVLGLPVRFDSTLAPGEFRIESR